MSIPNFNPLDYPTKWSKPESKISITISATINFSESKEKVIQAVKNIFPDLETHLDEKNILVGISHQETTLFHFCKQIFNQKILDGARKCVIDGIQPVEPNSDQKSTVFYLNKQIALTKKVNFCSPNDSPLGPIEVKIENNNLELLIDSYFPKFEWFNSTNVKNA